MPRITPALIADYIETAFDSLRERGTIGSLERGYLQPVGILVAMLDRLDEQYLAGLSAQQYREVTIASECLKATVEGWKNPRTPGRGDYSVGPFAPLEMRHPIVVIRDALRAAPEEPIAAARPRLAFLRAPDLEESIATDLASAESAMANGHYKSACVMFGAALEALLLWVIANSPSQTFDEEFGRVQHRRGREARPPLQALRKDPKEWTLEQYIEICRELRAVSVGTATASLLAKDFRNLIHPGRAERLQTKATRGAAAQAFASVSLALEDLSQGAS